VRSTCLGGRRVLNELHDLILVDHLARRDREVAADFEILAADCRIFRTPAAGLEILGQHLHAAHQVCRRCWPGSGAAFRVRQHEVRRRDRVGDLRM